MGKKLFLGLFFFGLSPLVLGLSLYFSTLNFSIGLEPRISFQKPSSSQRVLGEAVRVVPQNNLFAALPEETGALATTIKAEPAIPIMIENYLRYYNSPLLYYKNKILETAQKYNVKPQLIVAIAQQESNLGKKSPENCYNAWGWAIHEKGTMCFKDWNESIEVVTRGIAKSYCEKGYCDDPCLMMKKYTPKSNGSWCIGVNFFLNELETGNF